MKEVTIEDDGSSWMDGLEDNCWCEDEGLEAVEAVETLEMSLAASRYRGAIGGLWDDIQRIMRNAAQEFSDSHKRMHPGKPPKRLTTGKHGYRIRKWVK